MHQPSPRALFQVLPVCLSLVACGGGIDKAAKADIERRVAVMSPSGLFFPAPSVFVPRPLAIGQWTQHRLTNAKGELSFVTYKVVDRPSDAYWIEVADESYAPANANDAIKAAATAVIGRHDEEGIAHFLRERFGL